MAFDPLSWAIGFSLTQGTKWLLGEIYSKELPNKLNKIASDWANSIPKDSYVYPDAIFNYKIIDVEDKVALKILRDKLESKQIPEESEWLEALKEQWIYVKDNISEPQPFFAKDYDEIEDYLVDLSNKITIEIVSDSKYFNNEALKRIKEIQKNQQANSKEILNIKEILTNDNDWIYEPNEGNISDSPITVNKYFLFSNCLVRSIYIDPLTKRIHRQLKFRIKLIDNTKPIYNINLNFYLLVKRFVNQPDGSIGYARNWHKLWLQEQDNFIPKLTNYWSISYFIDPKVNEGESPFFKYHDFEKVFDVRLRLYLDGETEQGKRVFSEWEYDWSKESTIFGRFKLREPGIVKMTDERLNDVLKLEDDNFDWPLFDINRIEK